MPPQFIEGCGIGLGVPGARNSWYSNGPSSTILRQLETGAMMAEYFRFACPKCGQRLKARHEAVGRQAHCKRCEARFEVPDPATLKHEPQTPRNPEAALAAAETDPAPMVLKDQTSANIEPPPPRRRTPVLATPRKGCGRSVGLAGLTVVVGCAVIGVAAYGIGDVGSGTNNWPAETTSSSSTRPSDTSQQSPAPVKPPSPSRTKNPGKSKRSPVPRRAADDRKASGGMTPRLAVR